MQYSGPAQDLWVIWVAGERMTFSARSQLVKLELRKSAARWFLDFVDVHIVIHFTCRAAKQRFFSSFSISFLIFETWGELVGDVRDVTWLKLEDERCFLAQRFQSKV